MRADLISGKKGKRIWQIITVPERVDHRGNIKENGKTRIKYGSCTQTEENMEYEN